MRGFSELVSELQRSQSKILSRINQNYRHTFFKLLLVEPFRSVRIRSDEMTASAASVGQRPRAFVISDGSHNRSKTRSGVPSSRRCVRIASLYSSGNVPIQFHMAVRRGTATATFTSCFILTKSDDSSDKAKSKYGFRWPWAKRTLQNLNETRAVQRTMLHQVEVDNIWAVIWRISEEANLVADAL